jgi:hypothetical protein
MLIDLTFESMTFSGHEGFAPRLLWPKKAYDAAARDPESFAEDDAMVSLGVGKNMVRAIRHWGIAFGILEEEAESRGRRIRPTPFGESLLSDKGWDPFLEDPATLWALHWRLARNTTGATSAAWLFARPRGGRFSRDEIVSELELLIKDSRARKVPRDSLRRDVEVLVRLYARGIGTRVGRARTPEEDQLDSPLCGLGLLRAAHEKGSFELAVGPQPTLPSSVLHAAIIEFATTSKSGARTLPLQTLLYAPFSPGRVFRLTEDALASRLTELEGARHLRFDETAGLRQLILGDDMPEPMDILARHYETSGGRE